MRLVGRKPKRANEPHVVAVHVYKVVRPAAVYRRTEHGKYGCFSTVPNLAGAFGDSGETHNSSAGMRYALLV